MNANTAIETLKALLTPGTTVLTQVNQLTASKSFVLAFVRDKQNPMALIPLNLLIEKSELFDKKLFDQNGFKVKHEGTDPAFYLVYELENRLFGGYLPHYASGDMKLRLTQIGFKLGWFLGGESPNKEWLIKSDFEGGQVSAFVVTGTRQDAEDAALWHANEIAGVNGLYREDKSKWVFQDFDALCERLSMQDDEDSSFWSDHDCALIYQLSIEEVL
jgi:hypothetical protein